MGRRSSGPFITWGLTVVWLSVAATANATPIIGGDDLQIGDRVLITTPGPPANFLQGVYRVQELAGPPSDGDPLADFLTFCIESGAPIATGVFVVTGFGIEITPQTAYLYDTFRRGGLGGYPPGPGEPLFAVSGVQAAIYYLEGDPSGIDNALAQQARCAVAPAPGCPPVVPWGTTLGAVRTLHLAFENGQPAQRLLVWPGPSDQVPPRPDPVPEPTSMLLLGTGVAWLASRRRRYRV